MIVGALCSGRELDELLARAARVLEDHGDAGGNQCALAELSEQVGRLPCVGHDDPRGQTISRQLLMRPELASIIFAIGLLIGFALGYGVRAFVSYRRHQASRRRHYIQ